MADSPEPVILSADEIEAMNTYLEEHPPLVGPPPDLPFFDVRRIADTLLFLSNRVDNEARRSNQLVKERDEARQIATHLMKHSVNCWSYQSELMEAYPWMRDQK